MRRFASITLLSLGLVASVGCRSSPCEPSMWDRMWNRQPTMMMGEPCPCESCGQSMSMSGGGMMYDGPIFAAPPGTTAGAPQPLRGDMTSQPKPLPEQKEFARPRPYVPEKDGK